MNWNITEEHKTHLSAFFTDFWSLIKASYEVENSDQYWETLVKWCDALMTKHDDPMVNRIVMAYLDSQSIRGGSNG